MKSIQPFVLSRLARPWSRVQRRFQQSRPGSVLIMVVALLVLLALMGTAYVASARLERFASVTGTSSRAMTETADAYAKGLFEEIKDNLIADAGNLVTCPTDTTSSTLVLAPRAPMLLPNLAGAGPATTPPALANVPVWASVSRKQGVNFDSPWVPSAAAISTYTATGSGSYLAPSNVVVQYPTNNASTDPALSGQTRTFPAFMQYTVDPNNPAQYLTLPTGAVAAGPYLAASATGNGIADTALRRLTTSPIQGVDFYGGIRVITHGDAFNVNTAWSPGLDLDRNNNCFNFFPSDLDLIGAMNSTLAANVEMDRVNTRRFSAGALNRPRLDDANNAGVDHTNIDWLNPADEFWNQIGRRIDYPQYRVGFGDPFSTPTFGRPFSESDTAALAWHGGMVDLDNPLSKLDQLLSTGATANRDSIFAGAMNAVQNSQNRFRYLAANNVGYWFDWNWNFENAPSSTAMGMYFPIAAGGTGPKAVNGRPYRPIRNLVTANNPVAHLVRFVDFSTLPDSIKSKGNPSDSVLGPADPYHPHKASLNTADFPELWRAFINAMGTSRAPAGAGTMVPLYVPGDDPNNPATANGGTFRNVLRHPNSGSSKSTAFASPINNATERLDSKSVLALRAALAAVNVETYRESHGYNPTASHFIPNPARETFSLKTVAGTSVQAIVYGVTANPYIVEVYANTDNTDHMGKKNDQGMAAIKLFNPYPYDLDLKNYRLAVIDRKAGGTFPNMKVTMLAAFVFNAGQQTLSAGKTLLLTNFSSAGGTGGNPNATYWPLATGLTEPAPADPKVLVVPDLNKVLDGGTGQAGELVLLRSLLPGGVNPEVPVDSYDFTGLAPGIPTHADGWHYLRTASVTKAADRWKFMFPGEYDASKGNSGSPRWVSTEIENWDPSKDKETWEAAPPPSGMHLDQADTTAPYTIPFTGIQLCNVDSGGFNKFVNGAPRVYPYGGFARAGDVIQAPFIGSYILTAQPKPIAPGQALDLANNFTVIEVNPVSVDTCFADDGDQSDDAEEQIGRFCPLVKAGGGLPIDDYSPYGYYTDKDPGIPNPPGNVSKAFWRYRFAMFAMDQFTAVSNPDSDFFPNIAPTAWQGGPLPIAVPNSPATVGKANVNNEFVTEGLLNINSASWRMIAAMEMIPASQGGNAAYNGPTANPRGFTNNEMLAQFIVRYRDVDDGIKRTSGAMTLPPAGHGPFISLMELNKVFDPGDNTRATLFQNALGKLLPNVNDPTYYGWGNYAPGPAFQPAKGTPVDNLPPKDWMQQTLMVDRISNLVTLRSDYFTAYVVVQGWRNVGTPYPELVIEKRLAALIDRSALGTGKPGSTVRTYNVPTD
jgi:hypothetical protein